MRRDSITRVQGLESSTEVGTNTRLSRQAGVIREMQVGVIREIQFQVETR